MKIGEQFIDGDGTTFHVKQTFDPNPVLDEVKALRQNGVKRFGESVHVGRIPAWLVTIWLKEAGVRWDDSTARNEIINKKLQSGDYSAFRNWEGRY